jgi:hypothetical protein
MSSWLCTYVTQLVQTRYTYCRIFISKYNWVFYLTMHKVLSVETDSFEFSSRQYVVWSFQPATRPSISLALSCI